MSSTHGQQPIQRTVGRRKPRDGQPLDARDREVMAALARYRTRAPKGVFIYYSAEEMQRDRLRWTVDSVTIRVLDLEGLLQTKQGLRPKDQMDAAVIAAAIRALADED